MKNDAAKMEAGALALVTARQPWTARAASRGEGQMDSHGEAKTKVQPHYAKSRIAKLFHSMGELPVSLPMAPTGVRFNLKVQVAPSMRMCTGPMMSSTLGRT
jgi:hypothetical protein